MSFNALRQRKTPKALPSVKALRQGNVPKALPSVKAPHQGKVPKALPLEKAPRQRNVPKTLPLGKTPIQAQKLSSVLLKGPAAGMSCSSILSKTLRQTRNFINSFTEIFLRKSSLNPQLPDNLQFRSAPCSRQ